ncbi:choline dehydrogenase, partial [Vibrio parahaemolyticus AQ3810]
MSMHMALATSLASIIVTSGSSALNHLKLGNVDMFVVKWLMPGVVIGGFVGANIAEWIPTHYLPKVFGVIVLCLAVQMFRSIKVKSEKPMPSSPVTMMYGTGIGVVSSLAGIGGGSLSVPFLNKHGVEMRKAVGVEFEKAGSIQQCFAKNEVISSAGSIGSVQLLQLSGIGPKDVLEKAGIELKHQLEGVGKNLQDHLEVYFQYHCKQPITLNSKLG